MKRHSTNARRPAFTLIEILIVIAIIGVLMGLGISAISVGRRVIQQRAIALEVTTIGQAVEAYKQKYQQYPPDGTSAAAFQSHFKAVFPNILPSEFDVLTNSAVAVLANGSSNAVSSVAPGAVMDPAEALVFCLGGFSKDPTRPFTGKGGPLIEVKDSGGASFNPKKYQYNTDRDESLFPFNAGNLTIVTVPGPNGPNDLVTISSDEDPTMFGTGVADAMPVYVPKGRTQPVVYFASPTYQIANYTGTGIRGVAKPYKSETVNTSVTWSTTTANRYYKFMNDKSFQVISAGLDDDFGGANLNNASNLYYTYPSGMLIDISSNAAALSTPLATNYQSGSGQPSTQVDNVTNFSDGILEDALP